MKMFKPLLAIMIVILIGLVGCGKAEQETTVKKEEAPVTEAVMAKAMSHTPSAEEIGTEIACTMCKMKMTVTEKMAAAEYDGKSYFFCNNDEKETFMADAATYANPAEAADSTHSGH